MIDRLRLDGMSRLPLQQTAPTDDAIALGKKFSAFLHDAINSLNVQQEEVHKLNTQFILGDLEDAHQLLIAAQKASISLELTVQVRNKVIEAYQEIMRMQI